MEDEPQDHGRLEDGGGVMSSVGHDCELVDFAPVEVLEESPVQLAAQLTPRALEHRRASSVHQRAEAAVVPLPARGVALLEAIVARVILAHNVDDVSLRVEGERVVDGSRRRVAQPSLEPIRPVVVISLPADKPRGSQRVEFAFVRGRWHPKWPATGVERRGTRGSTWRVRVARAIALVVVAVAGAARVLGAASIEVRIA